MLMPLVTVKLLVSDGTHAHRGTLRSLGWEVESKTQEETQHHKKKRY